MLLPACQPNRDEWFCYHPDLGSVCRLLTKAWARPCREYTPDLLRSHFCRYSPDFAEVGLYVGDTLAGYVCHVPMHLQYADQVLSTALCRFWTSDPELRHRNIGFKVQERIMDRARQKGIEGVLAVCETDSRAAGSLRSAAGRLGNRCQLLMVFDILMGLPRRIRRRLGQGPLAEVTPYDPGNRAACFAVLDGLSRRCHVARRVPQEEIDFLLSHRAFTKTWIFAAADGVRALLNGTLASVLGADRKSCNFYIDTLICRRLSRAEFQAFLRSVFSSSFWDEVDGVFVASTGCFEPEALLSGGFVCSNTRCDLYFIPFRQDILEQPTVQSCYLDVF